MADFIDIFDEHGNPTGDKVERYQAHELGLWHKTAHIWIINSKGELLLQLRGPQKKTSPNKWDISAAGHIDAGETTITGGLRELKEELGVEISASELKKIFTEKTDKNPKNKELADIFLVQLDWPIEKYVLNNREVAAVKYVHWRELAKLSLEEMVEQAILPHAEFKGLFEYLESQTK